MGKVYVITSGKGGVGKSIYSLNIAITLAKQCKKVILVDGILIFENKMILCNKIAKNKEPK